MNDRARTDTARRGTQSRQWLTALLAQQLGGSIALDLGIDDLGDFRVKHPEASAMLTRDSVATLEVMPDRRIVVNFLDGILDRHELAPSRGGYRFGNYFEFGNDSEGDGSQTAKIIGIDRAGSNLATDDVHTMNDFLRGCASPSKGGEAKIDLRLVGDVEENYFTAPDGHVIVMKNLVILAYCPEKNILVARNRDGELYFKATAKVLAKPDEIDNISTWTPIRVMSDAKVFRAGRFGVNGNIITAPISATDGHGDDDPKHGVMTINLANMKAEITIAGTDDETTGFVVTKLGDGGVMTYRGDGTLARLSQDRVGKVYEPLLSPTA